MNQLSPIDWIVCLAYLAVVVGLAVWSMRGQRDNEDYFVGGRRMNWFAVGISMFATSFSSISFLGLPQRGAYQDFSFYLMILRIPAGDHAAAVVLLRAAVRPAAREQRLPVPAAAFQPARAANRFAALLRLRPGVDGRHAVRHRADAAGRDGLERHAVLWTLIGLGIFATAYTAVGGLRAVVWTDVLQAVTLGGAVVVVLLLAVAGIAGGWSGLWEIGSEHGRLTMFHLESNPLAARELHRAQFGLHRDRLLAVHVPARLRGRAEHDPALRLHGRLAPRPWRVAAERARSTPDSGFCSCSWVSHCSRSTSSRAAPGCPSLESEDQILPHFVATRRPASDWWA